jgi:hypothetical protein
VSNSTLLHPLPLAISGYGMTRELNKDTVPLRSGPPTREELVVYYPGKCNWTQLKTFINAGWVTEKLKLLSNLTIRAEILVF